jgi:peptidoglycan-associated lipoprotein
MHGVSNNNQENMMNTALRLVMAALIAMAIVACQPKPKPTEEVVVDEKITEDVVVEGAPDPRDYTDARNFDNPESLLSKRVVYFDFDKSTVRSEYRGIVAAHAAYLAAHSGGRVTLEGHTDERGTREYNLGLGERRGNAVMGLMSAQGARGDQLVVVSYGEERPVCRVSDESCWAENRRVEIVYTAR